MDLSALERNISRLEASLGSLELWLALMTGLVVIGLVLEYWHEIPEVIDNLKRSWSWKPLCIIAGAILITVGVAGELGIQFVASGKETELRKANDAVFAGLNVEAATAREEASKADERASNNEKEAAQLRKQLAPRTVSESDRRTLGTQLRPFAPSFSGRQVKVSSYTADADGMVFSLEIMDVLSRAGIHVEPLIGRIVPVGLVDVGVKVTGPSADEKFISTLLTGIKAHLDTSLSWETGSKYTEVSIEVGVKPVAGLPVVVSAAP